MRKLELEEALRMCHAEQDALVRAGATKTMPNFSRIAATFTSGLVLRSTLSDTFRGMRNVAAKAEQSRLLSDAQEQAVIGWTRLRAYYGKPWSRRDIAAHVAMILGRSPGKHWVTRFIKRHPQTLRKSRAYALDLKRAMNVTRANV